MNKEEIEKFREEKAIEIFRDILEQEKKEIGRNSIYTIEYQIILDLIDKLQKENKELKERIKNQYELINELEKCVTPKVAQKIFRKNLENKKELDNSISKDKIREVLKDIYFYYGQNNDMFLVDKIREELLGE